MSADATIHDRFPFLLTAATLAALKRSLQDIMPRFSSGHLDEGLAAGLGHRSYAALLERQRRRTQDDVPDIAFLDPAALLGRLRDLEPANIPTHLRFLPQLLGPDLGLQRDRIHDGRDAWFLRLGKSVPLGNQVGGPKERLAWRAMMREGLRLLAEADALQEYKRLVEAPSPVEGCVFCVRGARALGPKTLDISVRLLCASSPRTKPSKLVLPMLDEACADGTLDLSERTWRNDGRFHCLAKENVDVLIAARIGRPPTFTEWDI